MRNLKTSYRVRGCNVNKTFQDYGAELIHNLYHWFVIFLQEAKRFESLNQLFISVTAYSFETFGIFYLRLSDGLKQASNLFENCDRQAASAHLTRAEQDESQSLHSVENGGVGTSLSGSLDIRVGLHQL